MDLETQARTAIVSPVSIDLNIHLIRDAFSEIGEIESVHIDPDQGCAYVTYKHQKSALLAVERDGASIQGHRVNIRLMAREDPSTVRLNNRIQGDDLQVKDYEKKAFSILSYPENERQIKLKELLLLMTPQQKDVFLETYSKCEQIHTIRRRFDEAIAKADDPNYTIQLSPESRSSRSRSRSRHHRRHRKHHSDRHRYRSYSR